MTDTARELPISALLVGIGAGERQLLRDTFQRCGWRLFEACDRGRGLQSLERNPVQVVIAESDLPKWNWQKVLGDLRDLAFPPQLVVTSRTADEHLWAEVLNIGAYDVLAQPLDREEVRRVVAAASRQFGQQHVRQQSLAVPA